jgi:hypothetical protein
VRLGHVRRERARIGRWVAGKEHCGVVFYPADDPNDNDRVEAVMIYGSTGVIGPSVSMLSLPLLCWHSGVIVVMGNATINARLQG